MRSLSECFGHKIGLLQGGKEGFHFLEEKKESLEKFYSDESLTCPYLFSLGPLFVFAAAAPGLASLGRGMVRV